MSTNPSQRVRAAAARRDRARQALDSITADLREVVLTAIEEHGMSEAEASRLAGVGRMTVRKWRAEARDDAPQ